MRICFIGDSFTNGTGDDDALGWPGRIVVRARATGRDITYYNLGIRRDTSADIAKRWREEVGRRLLPEHVKRLAFSFGANDCATENNAPRVPFEAALANTDTILRAAMTFAPTIMISPLPAADDDAAVRRTRALAAAQEELCETLGVPYLAAFDFIHGSAAWRDSAKRGDGVHPNREGYAALADFIWTWPPLHRWLAA